MSQTTRQYYFTVHNNEDLIRQSGKIRSERLTHTESQEPDSRVHTPYIKRSKRAQRKWQQLQWEPSDLCVDHQTQQDLRFWGAHVIWALVSLAPRNWTTFWRKSLFRINRELNWPISGILIMKERWAASYDVVLIFSSVASKMKTE